MQFRAALTLALPAIVAATVIPRTGGRGDCNTGPMQCCNAVQAVGS